MRTAKKVMMISAAVFALGAGTIAASQPQTNFGDMQTVAPVAFTDPANVSTDLAQLDAVLNSIASFEGRFLQYNPDGSRDKGKIYLSRPGRLRFEYEAPNPLLVVSNGVTLVQHDKMLETTDRVPLSSTPLNYFLKENVQLERDTEVVSLIKSEQDIRVTSVDGSGETDGAITMVFDPETLAWRAWIIQDAMGGETVVELADLRYNGDINPRIFLFDEDDNRRERDRRRR